jgi:hypothetical protein
MRPSIDSGMAVSVERVVVNRVPPTFSVIHGEGSAVDDTPDAGWLWGTSALATFTGGGLVDGV